MIVILYIVVFIQAILIYRLTITPVEFFEHNEELEDIIFGLEFSTQSGYFTCKDSRITLSLGLYRILKIPLYEPVSIELLELLQKGEVFIFQNKEFTVSLSQFDSYTLGYVQRI